jgi:hypothetical protein
MEANREKEIDLPVFVPGRFVSSILVAQRTPDHPAEERTVPHLVQFSGMVSDVGGKPLAGMTFALYKDQQGRAPLWIETQNVALDQGGRYSVLLGATQDGGLPAELFTSGEARWVADLGLRAGCGARRECRRPDCSQRSGWGSAGHHTCAGR